MGTALFTGVTGLKAQQLKLDVVANNIANVNTVGYRSSRVLFQDLFSQTLAGGSAAVDNFGGTNPSQIGLGVQIGSIDVNHEQGSLLTTGKASDLAVQGNGFFVLSNGIRTVYTRDGSFSINANGELYDPATGYKVQGFLADDTGAFPSGALPQNIQIPVGATGIVRATSQANFIGNLNPTADPNNPGAKSVSRTVEFFDSLGETHLVDVAFTQSLTNPNQWSWTATHDNGTSTVTVGTGTLNFTSGGTLDTATSTPNTITLTPADLGNPSASPDTMTINVDFSKVTQLANGDDLTSDVTLRNQDGFPRGVLESFNISANGDINGVFTNGLTRTLAKVALASFSNVAGLLRDGANGFTETPSSGSPQVGTPTTGGRGSVSGGVLENSNVDLGTEFSNLIVTQRSFQANARTITSADTLLQETVNLVR